ncbi:Ubiquinone biosynthesis hydroxylase, UbiH/UbiF/VisC/COQ6 family [Sphingomonas gellani]|uniref:Ubiquinone biosynthesis hydroxylase, UbiH/UbiF/VisC/COQ6 family n=1 Tax=Sphingomonas gellani TaxID=1166340 RepID=A0A1H8AMU1_9SPHN|nr:5-demethoxyubiquinol-8 5-hydroxylase UbiM [Sphingomonas gellani]SEM71168.1 Ubiquinone biosynthesis hydroxylase, UbiH/UbiF/VisC/COQ6 family [Sphingomonas gellani]
MAQDVVVVGGGPAGLAFARSLAGSGLAVTVVERQPLAALQDPTCDGREIALTHRSVTTLTALGAWAHLDPEDIAPLREARVLNGSSRFALSFDTGATGEDRLGQLVPNHRIRRALFLATRDQPGLDLIAGVDVGSVTSSAAGRVVTLADGRVLRPRLLVAADSRFSAVREQLGIAAEVNRLGRSMLVCRVAHDGDHGGSATEWFEHGHTIAMLPLNGTLSSAVLTLPAEEAERIAALDPVALGAEITRRYDARLGAMRVVEGPRLYPLATTYARHFVATGAALIGDAAVGMHPVTAHGFNLGLQGQATLAALVNKAAARGCDIATPLLLRRYEAAHRLASRPIYAATNLLVGLYTDERPAARLARHATLRAGARLPMVRDAVSRLLMQP